MVKNCAGCVYFVNNTCINKKSDYSYQAVNYDVCRYWKSSADKN